MHTHKLTMDYSIHGLLTKLTSKRYLYCTNSQMVPIPITTEQKFPLWTRFHPILHIKEVLDCFRLNLLLLLLVLLVLLLGVLIY